MKRQGAKDAEDAKEKKMRNEPSVELDACAYAVIGAAIEVHRILGPGFLESTYEEALCAELSLRQISFSRQVTLPVEYKGRVISESRLDLLVADELVVELKAVEQLRPIHCSQVLSYLRAGGFQLGVLINFNVVRLKEGIQRVVWTG